MILGFVGLGLGSILAQTKHVTDGMVEASALALAKSLTDDERALEMVYPRVERIREISALIATCVIRAAQKDVSCHLILENKPDFLRLAL